MAFLKNNPTEFAQLDDQQLVAAILQLTNREQQRHAREELYGRYADKVYFRCLGLVKEEETAKDLAQDILVKMFLKLADFKGTGPFYGWLFAMTYNHCINFLKKKKRLRTEELGTLDLPTDQIEAEHEELLELRLGQLEKLLELLSDEARLVLLLRYQEGKSVIQMAEMMGLGESAVKMRLKRSRDHLAELFKNLGT